MYSLWPGLVIFLNHDSSNLSSHIILTYSHYIIAVEPKKAFNMILVEFKKKIILPYFDNIGKRYNSTGRCIQERFWGCNSTGRKTCLLCFKKLDNSWEELPKSRKRMHGCYMGYGEIPFLIVWQIKPLDSIFKKHMIDVSPRIQRIGIRNWPYKFTTEWISGKKNSVADVLSCVSSQEAVDL